MANASVMGLDNELKVATASSTVFRNALDDATDVWVEATASAQSADFLWANDYVFRRLQDGGSDLWVGILCNGSVRVSLTGYPDIAGNPSGAEPMGVYNVESGATFRRVSPGGAGSSPFAYSQLTGSADTNYTVRVALTGTGELVSLWLGIPLILPYQWQTGGASGLSSQYVVEAPFTEAGTFGGQLQRPKPGRLRATMPNVPNEWIWANWVGVRRFISRSPFWHALWEDQTEDHHYAEAAFAWQSTSPPPVDVRPAGHSTISIDALTYPDYSGGG